MTIRTSSTTVLVKAIDLEDIAGKDHTGLQLRARQTRGLRNNEIPEEWSAEMTEEKIEEKTLTHTYLLQASGLDQEADHQPGVDREPLQQEREATCLQTACDRHLADTLLDEKTEQEVLLDEGLALLLAAQGALRNEDEISLPTQDDLPSAND